MGKLCQIVAVEKGVKSRVYNDTTTLHKALQKPALFNGFHKKYAPINTDGEQLPPEAKKVEFSAADILKTVKGLMTESITLEARKDWTNCVAKADVKIDGNVLIAGAPISFLLYLEKQLNDVKTLTETLPLLDPAEDWTFDEQASLWKTNETQTHRTKKEQRSIMLVPPTDKHPGQAQLITEDTLVGYWGLVKQSGAMSKPDKLALVSRIDTLLDAVKSAREEANMTEEEVSPDAGAAVFKYILG